MNYHNYPYIKTFQLVTGNYVYDVNNNSILKIKSIKLFRQILQIQKIGFDAFFEITPFAEQKEILELQSKGFITRVPDGIIYNTMSEYSPYYLNSHLRSLILQVTQDCNLRCTYCPYSWSNNNVEREHNNSVMSWETAKKAIDFFYANSFSIYEKQISFYGGEPLLRKSFIKKCIEYIENNYSSFNTIFIIITNGILLTDDFISFMSNKKFEITVSFDGPEDVQNSNRRLAKNGKGSYSIVYNNLKNIVKNYPDLISRFRINAVWNMMDDYKTISEFFATDGIISRINSSIDEVDDSFIPDTSYKVEKNQIDEKEKVLSYLVNCKELGESMKAKEDETIKSLVTELNNIIKKINNKDPLEFERFHIGPCMPGISKLFIDVDGNMFPCEKASDECLIFGNVNTKIDHERIKTIMNLGYITSEKCGNCWAFRFCGFCQVFASNGSSFSKEMLLEECELFKKDIYKNLAELIYYKELGIISNDGVK